MTPRVTAQVTAEVTAQGVKRLVAATLNDLRWLRPRQGGC